MRDVSSEMIALLSNREVIAINQGESVVEMKSMLVPLAVK